MPDQLQLRGGTTTEHNTFTGVTREVTVDTTKKTLVVHDGSQAGGTPLMRESGGNAQSTVGIGTAGVSRMNMSATEVVFNETGANTDFRIEGDGETNLFKVDASINRIGIGIATPQTLMHIHGASGRLQFTDDTTGTGSGDGIITGLNGDQDFFINNRESGKNILMFTGGASLQRLHIGSTGKIGINDSTPDADLSVSNSNTSLNAAFVDIGKAGGQRFKLGYEGNNCFFGGTSSTAMFIFKQNVGDADNPQASGSEVGRFDQNGRFLVGTTTSQMNETGFNEIVVSGATEGAALHLSDDNGNVKGGMFTSDSSNTMFVRTITNHDLAFRTNNTERMRINNGTGEIGIGLDAGASQGALQIAGGLKIAGSAAASDTSSPYIFRTSGADDLNFATSSNTRLTVKSDGNIRIVDQHLRFNVSGKGVIFGTEGGTNRPSIVGNYTSSTNNNIQFSTTGNTRLTLDEDGFLGVGNSNPGATVDIQGTSANENQILIRSQQGGASLLIWNGQGVTNSGDDSRLGIGRNDVAMIYTPASANPASALVIGNTDSVPIVFSTGNTKRMRILGNNGNVGIGLDDPDQKLEVDGIIKGSSYFQGGASATASNNYHFGAEGNGEFRIYSGNYGAGDHVLSIASKNLEVIDGNVKVASGHGIDFSATGDGSGTDSSELLDDYEEGTFTPTQPTIGTNSANGHYTKIGRHVYASIFITLPNNSSAQSFVIDGLPYSTRDNSGTYIHGGYVIYSSYNAQVYVLAHDNSDRIQIYNQAGSPIQLTTLDNINFRIQLHYNTNE
tara:strand:- start:842 stop:3202 length:2361 start_codon:yes stop_codon:yes gene_type:complete